MKKTIILLICIILTFVMSNLSLYFLFSGKLKKTNLITSDLRTEIKDLEMNYLQYRHETGEQLKTLEETIIFITQVNSEQTAALNKINTDSINKRNTLTPQKTNLTNYQSRDIENSPTPEPEKNDFQYRDDVKLSNYFATGQTAFESGSFAQARLSFQKLLNLNPPIWESHLYYIRAAYEENPGKAATNTTVRKLLDTFPEKINENGQVSKFRGLFALETGEYRLGLSLINESLALNPGDRRLHLQLGIAAFVYNDYTTCISSLEKANLEKPDYIYTLGRAYEKLNRWDSALSQYKRCLTVDNSFYKAYERISIIEQQTGIYNETVENKRDEKIRIRENG